MITAILKPFIETLFKRRIAISRWSLLKTLIRLAFLKRFFSAKKEVKVRLGTFVIHAPGYDEVSTLLKEKFADEEYYFSSENPKPVIIDGGANIGISVLYFKSLYPEAEIHCFEPYALSFEYLEKNVRVNNLKNVFLHRSALGAENGEILLFVPDNNTINATVVKSETMSSVVVQSTSLSLFIQKLNHVDLLKLDVEGAEVDILTDLYHSGELANRRVKTFIIEYHTAVNGSEKSFCEMFTTCGYTVSTKVLFPANPQSDILITAKV